MAGSTASRKQPTQDPGRAIAECAPRLPYHPALKERFGITPTEWKPLVEAIFPLAQSMNSVVLALSYCKARKLDPFKKCVHIVPMWNSGAGRMLDTIWPGIGELRTTAFRTKQYAGRDKTEFGPDITKEWTLADKSKVTVTFPEWAQVTLYRMIEGQKVGFAGPQVYWLETYAKMSHKEEAPNSMWKTRPRGQLDKCFDSETEVLTDQGFQRFGFVTGRIMQVTGHGIEPTTAEPFGQPYDGQMILCGGNALNFCVTPNHDMATSVGKVEAQQVFDDSTSLKGYEIPMVLSQLQSPAVEPSYSDKQLVLAAAIVCDGYKSKGGFAIAVSKPSKVRDIGNLNLHKATSIRKCAGDRAAHTATRTIVTRFNKTVFEYAREVCGDLLIDSGCLNTEAIVGLTRRQARLIADQMIRFDGAATKTARRFYSSDLAVMGSFELLCVIAGYSVSRRRERTSDIGGRNWYVTVSTKERCKTMRASKSQARLKGGMRLVPNVDGRVWCCRVPSGYIVVRRNGLSMLCGNCAEAASLRAAFPEEVGNEYCAEEMEGRTIDGESKVLSDGQGTDALLDRLEGPTTEETADTDEQAEDKEPESEKAESDAPKDGLFTSAEKESYYQNGN